VRSRLERWYDTEGVIEMTAREGFTAEEARRIGEEIGIEWASSPFETLSGFVWEWMSSSSMGSTTC
jgi:hypothetical protein